MKRPTQHVTGRLKQRAVEARNKIKPKPKSANSFGAASKRTTSAYKAPATGMR